MKHLFGLLHHWYVIGRAIIMFHGSIKKEI